MRPLRLGKLATTPLDLGFGSGNGGIRRRNIRRIFITHFSLRRRARSSTVCHRFPFSNNDVW
jgi:hypothetical protein